LTMRVSFLIIAALVLSACSRGEPSVVTVELNKVKRVNGCNVLLRDVTTKSNAAWMAWVCNVPESAPNWWGEEFEPPDSTLLEGDCVRLDQTYYCVKDINPEDMSVTLKATYKPIARDYYEHLRPIE
jgi:hypothetical protein